MCSTLKCSLFEEEKNALFIRSLTPNRQVHLSIVTMRMQKAAIAICCISFIRFLTFSHLVASRPWKRFISMFWSVIHCLNKIKTHRTTKTLSFHHQHHYCVHNQYQHVHLLFCQIFCDSPFFTIFHLLQLS